MFLDSDRIIFINYTPGSFGSFLSSCLRMSPSVHNKLLNKDIFNEYGSAHKQLIEYMIDFHQHGILSDWVNYSDEQKHKTILHRWQPPDDFEKSSLFYIHRLIIPNSTDVFVKFFPKSRFIKINVDDNEVDIISKMFHKKILNVENPTAPHKSKLAKKFIKTHINNDIIEGVYNFNVRWFLDGSFIKEFDKLCEYLNFKKVDITEIFNMYDQFKRANNL